MQAKACFTVAAVLAGAAGVCAQPMSAIDWLTDSVAVPPQLGMPQPEEAAGTTTESISVRAIDAPSMDGIGLREPLLASLPRDLWAQSDPGTLSQLIARTDLPVDAPEFLDLLINLLTVTATPPVSSGSEGDFFLARVDKLLELGALEPAVALLERANLHDPRVFKRWFDVRLLLGTEDVACDRLIASPDLSPTFPTTIFCLARFGDWDAAALTLDTAEALGLITPAEDALLLRFLDGSNASEDGPLTLPAHITPLAFRLYEAVGEPIPTEILPRAFVVADLSAQNGWKARLTAAERLAATGILGADVLFDIYREQGPAASGSVWDRARAVQNLDSALDAGDIAEINATLPIAWSSMSGPHLAVPFAQEFGPLLQKVTPDQDSGLFSRIQLLSGIVIDPDLSNGSLGFAKMVAAGKNTLPATTDPVESAIRQGLNDPTLPPTLEGLLDEGRVGEATLIAINLFSTGAEGDTEDLIYALGLLRRLGFEDTARKAALGLLILERRG